MGADLQLMRAQRSVTIHASPPPSADLSPKMVDFAAEQVAARGLSARISTRQADAQALAPFQVPSSRWCLHLLVLHEREVARQGKCNRVKKFLCDISRVHLPTPARARQQNQWELRRARAEGCGHSHNAHTCNCCPRSAVLPWPVALHFAIAQC